MKSIAPDNWSWSPIYFGDIVESLASFSLLNEADKLFVLVDENTQMHCLPRLEAVLEYRDHIVISIKAGESEKQLDTCQQIWSSLLDAGCSRHSLLINLGGGVIGDMGGFCAAVFKRGFRQIQIPTTLLAQVDASTGNKTGIDFLNFKNIIGAFYPPEAIFIDPVFLETLPDRERISGLAELVKHALIFDAELWQHCLSLGQDLVLTENLYKLIPKAVRIKCRVVESDPQEKGLRKILNFGHTIGHGIESALLATGTPVLHGEAVAAGMIMETYLSQQEGFLSESDSSEIISFLKEIFPKIGLNDKICTEAVHYMKQDKKNKGSAISFNLLEHPGKAFYDHYLSNESLINQALMAYKNL